MEAKVTKLVNKKVVEALKMMKDKVDKTYSSVLDEKNPKSCYTVHPLQQQNDDSNFDQNISQSLRMQGVAEDPQKTNAENLLSTEVFISVVGEKSFDAVKNPQQQRQQQSAENSNIVPLSVKRFKKFSFPFLLLFLSTSNPFC